MNTATIGGIRVRCDIGGETLLLLPGSELGAGGQATVYPVPGRPDRVAKVYHHPTPEQELKLHQMLAQRPVGAAPTGAGSGTFIFAWPQELLRDGEGRCVGVLLPRVDGKLRVFELYNPATRRDRAPLFHHGLLHRAARNLASAFHELHQAGFVVGDVNESNILVGEDGRVTLIDTDSFQVRDAVGGRVYRCPVGRPEFTAPELRERSFAETDRTPEHDRFGLGVLVFQMLMEGTHPFAGRYRGVGEPPSVQERIAAGHFPYARRAGGLLEPPRMAPPLEVLDPGLRGLLLRCFEDGHHDPAARPSAAEWRDGLEAAEGALVACERNEQHRYGGHLGACPWCERARRLEGRDPFPSAAAVRVGEHRRRPVPVRASRRPGATAARPLPVSYSDALHGLAFLVALVGIISVTIPPLFVALAAGGLILTARRRAQMARTGASPRWAPVPAMVLVLLGFVIGDGSPTPVVELPAAPAGDVSPVPFAYAPEALDRLPVLQDTAALLFAVEPLSRAYDPAEGEPEYQLRFVLDSWGRVDAETVRVLPDPGTYALGILLGRMDRVRFRPGELGGRFVRTEVQVPLRGVGGRVSPVLALGSWNPGMDGASTQADAPADAAPADVADAEVKPQLLNAAEVQALLAEMYPPLLRDAGITGQTEIRFAVDAEGAVDPTSIVVVSATHEALADASAAVVVGMRFSPARVKGRTVPVLVQIPITWTLER